MDEREKPDLVMRLRSWAHGDPSASVTYPPPVALLREAARRIEALEGERDDNHATAQAMHDAWQVAEARLARAEAVLREVLDGINCEHADRLRAALDRLSRMEPG